MARLTTAEAAHRLGVKPATIYAYVSRGVLTSRPSPDGRTSTFASSEIEQLARRGRPRQASRSTSLDFAIDTSITHITQDQLHYRGYDAIKLSTTATFEQAADLLLTGSLSPHRQWDGPAMRVPSFDNVFDHLIATALAVGSRDVFRADLSPLSVGQAARSIIATAIDSRPPLGDGRTPRLHVGTEAIRTTIAAQLWTRMSARRPPTGAVNVINASLVLLADHELAVSTVAARVAASARADPYAVVTAGAAAVSGPLHGGASRAARSMLDDAFSSGSIDSAVSQAGQRHGRYPGFGHTVYKSGDPRAVALLSMLRTHVGGSDSMRVVDGVIATVRRRHDIYPNIDLALAAIGLAYHLPEDSGEFTFSVARVAGWVAHAIEEYGEAPLRFRARANYVAQSSDS